MTLTPLAPYDLRAYVVNQSAATLGIHASDNGIFMVVVVVGAHSCRGPSPWPPPHLECQLTTLVSGAVIDEEGHAL